MKQTTKTKYRFLVNNLLLLSGIVMAISGLVLQIGFHIGSSGPRHSGGRHSHTETIEQVQRIIPDNTVWGIDYSTWSTIHKVAIVLFSLLMLYHLVNHWKWYKAILKNHLLHKNRQVMILSFLFILVALTGFIPWFIDLAGSKSIMRLILIEIHDKLAIILTGFLILHIFGRFKWFSNTFEKMRNKVSG